MKRDRNKKIKINLILVSNENDTVFTNEEILERLRKKRKLAYNEYNGVVNALKYGALDIDTDLHYRKYQHKLIDMVNSEFTLEGSAMLTYIRVNSSHIPADFLNSDCSDLNLVVCIPSDIAGVNISAIEMNSSYHVASILNSLEFNYVECETFAYNI